MPKLLDLVGYCPRFRGSPPNPEHGDFQAQVRCWWEFQGPPSQDSRESFIVSQGCSGCIKSPTLL